MRPNRIVVDDRGVNRLQCCEQCPEGHKEPKLHFKDAINTFCNGIFIGIAILCHRDSYEVFSKQCYVVSAAVLQTPVGMMDEILTCAHPSFIYGHLEGV